MCGRGDFSDEVGRLGGVAGCGDNIVAGLERDAGEGETEAGGTACYESGWGFGGGHGGGRVLVFGCVCEADPVEIETEDILEATVDWSLYSGWL